MPAETLTFDMSVKVPLPQLWEAFKDLHHLMPRLLPGFIESSKIVGGSMAAGVGGLRDCKFTSEVPGISWTQELIEEVDDEEHIFAYKVVDGELLQRYSSFRVKWRYKPQLAGSGTDVTWTADLAPLPSPFNFPTATAEASHNRGRGNDDEATASTAREDGRRKTLYRDSAQLLMKQLETHLTVTGEYSQPSAKDRLRDDILAK